jgi:hypothetical protein
MIVSKLSTVVRHIQLQIATHAKNFNYWITKDQLNIGKSRHTKYSMSERRKMI